VNNSLAIIILIFSDLSLHNTVCMLLIHLFCFNSAAMNTTISTVSSGSDKHLSETTVQTMAQNLTTMQQNVQNVQNVQSMVQSNISSIQPTQTIVGSMTPSGLVGKSVSLDMNPKLSLMKPVVPSGATSSTETSKITTTVILALC